MLKIGFKGRIDASTLRECVEAILAVVDEARLKISVELCCVVSAVGLEGGC